MGLYDRDYIREDDQPGFFLGAQRSMVTTLILINVGVFLIDLLVQGDLSRLLSLKSDVFQKPWNAWQLLTAGFAHDPNTLWHVGINMVGLWFFGRDIEAIYGRKEFLRIYLTMIILSSLVWVISVNTLHRGHGVQTSSMLGASGAVNGILVLNVIHFPKRLIYIWGIFPVPSWVFCTLIIGQDVLGFSHARGGEGEPIAHEAHLAGAAFAFLYYSTGWNLGRWLPRRLSLASFKPRPKLRVHEPDRDESLSDQVDRILEKISREGEASLTAQERRTLEDASRRYQQRRR
ncbi:MAG TPA: rhomboid family intramembrane serine protease [Pirellulales bacterium]|nr:rhomboid family intramembrane serine protease [Pirellulales bacterium]